ncbi:group I truncated hemoglobin [Rhodopila sp.]|uniref:group I truncated hemoglobin n=1 Tax=Rhodopila sp. TaxID=2480087 RepID=UPI003D13D4BB
MLLTKSAGFGVLFAATLAASALAQDSLFKDLGGQAGVARIADRSVGLFVADNRVKTDFDNINLDRLRQRLAEQFCQITGGPCVYHGHSMAEAHAGLDLTQAKFNAVAEDVQTAMRQIGIPYWTQNRLMARLAPMQRDVVTK